MPKRVREITWEVPSFDLSYMYVEGYGNKNYYELRSDGALIAKPRAGGWRGVVKWCGDHYELRPTRGHEARRVRVLADLDVLEEKIKDVRDRQRDLEEALQSLLRIAEPYTDI